MKFVMPSTISGFALTVSAAVDVASLINNVIIVVVGASFAGCANMGTAGQLNMAGITKTSR